MSKMSSHTLLCLGDSYTIGEAVADGENFPEQTVKLLSAAGYEFKIPEIIAKTGWTTVELQDAINKHSFRSSYDYVTLLIGVNNQYRGYDIKDYKTEFESLLQQAIHFANNKPDHVIVLSVPDWGATPFAKNRDRQQIAKEIDEYNAANKMIAEKYKSHWLDITLSTRESASDPSYLASDGLHPSGKEYARWAAKIAAMLMTGE